MLKENQRKALENAVNVLNELKGKKSKSIGMGITILDLAKNCINEVLKENGERIIFITSDDEANNYHKLFYILDVDIDEDCFENLKEDGCFENYEKENIALLG